MLCRAHLAEALPAGSHGSTFGGNALASAAGLAVLEALEEEKLVERAAKLGTELGAMLRELVRRHPTKLESSRGRGLLQALVFAPGREVRAVLGPLLDGGVLLTAAGPQALRFSPPLVVTESELEEGVRLVDKVLETIG
jgi:acetylornithine/N-succinyldiaminopimelate aminotransferase